MSPTSNPAPSVQTIRAKLKEAIAQLERRFLERDELIRLLLLGAIAGEHMLMVGPPGTAKSQLAKALSALFGDRHSFEYLLTRFTTPDELFGPVSLQKLKQDEYVRQTEGYLPEARFAFLDEIFKANSAILNALLSLLNERIYYNGRTRQAAPLHCLIAASNELPEDTDYELAAMYDRFLIRYEVDTLKQLASYERLFLLDNSPVPKLLDAEDAAHVQQLADSVKLPETLILLLYRLKTSLAKAGSELSDRRLRKIGKMWAISAALHGRAEASIWDTICTPHMLWERPEQLEEVQRLYDTLLEEALRDESEQSLHTRRAGALAERWESRKDELRGYQFRKEVGGEEAARKLAVELEQCRRELEEGARHLKMELKRWREYERSAEQGLRQENILLLDPSPYIVKLAFLRLEAEKVLQKLQALYKALFDDAIPGAEYDFTT